MYYDDNLGVTLGDYHTFRDFELYPVTRFYVSPPEPKTEYIDIPFSDGSLDLTETLSSVKYQDRTYTQTFKLICDRKYWSQRVSDIMNKIHGKLINIISDEDTSYFYLGRVMVESWSDEKKQLYVNFTGHVEPFKYERFSSTEDWLWDEFNFETDVMRDYKDLEVDNSFLSIYGSIATVIPTFIITESEDLILTSVNGEAFEFELDDGQYTFPEIELHDGENIIQFTGSGIVTVDFRGASL